MTDATLDRIQAHAAQELPRECCGLLVVRKGREVYWPCRNLAGAGQFRIDAEDYAAAEEAGDVLAVVHSHPYLPPTPSQADLVGCEASGLPWIILSWPTGALHECRPTGYVAPLIGRVFSHGVLDCYALVKDYYARETGIALPDFDRPDDWWKAGQNLYRDNFAAAGFQVIERSQLRPHDAILIQLGANVANHAAIYLGDGLILHHPMNRLSGREVFGGYWQKNAVLYLRHRELA